MSEKDQVMGRQIAAARAMVGISQGELAANARVSVPTLRRMEASGGPASGMANNVAAVKAALERAGIEFLDDGQVASGPGVALKASTDES